jgi:cytochrome P450
MGLPQSDLPTFLRWRDNVIRPDVAPDDWEGATRIREETGKAINTYFENAIAARRAQPDDGLLSQLVHTDLLPGESGRRPLNQEELLGICHLFLLGGLDTVTATLDCMIAYLARHPDRRAALVADPSQWPAAVEELLRHQSPVQMVPRICKQAVTMHGVDINPGDLVTLLIGAANGDEDAFADPDDVDLARDPHHLAFGGGNHLCLGAHLARLELRIGLEEFHARIPDYEIAAGAEIHYSPGIRQASTLPLVF